MSHPHRDFVTSPINVRTSTCTRQIENTNSRFSVRDKVWKCGSSMRDCNIHATGQCVSENTTTGNDSRPSKSISSEIPQVSRLPDVSDSHALRGEPVGNRNTANLGTIGELRSAENRLESADQDPNGSCGDPSTTEGSTDLEHSAVSSIGSYDCHGGVHRTVVDIKDVGLETCQFSRNGHLMAASHFWGGRVFVFDVSEHKSAKGIFLHGNASSFSFQGGSDDTIRTIDGCGQLTEWKRQENRRWSRGMKVQLPDLDKRKILKSVFSSDGRFCAVVSCLDNETETLSSVSEKLNVEFDCEPVRENLEERIVWYDLDRVSEGDMEIGRFDVEWKHWPSTMEYSSNGSDFLMREKRLGLSFWSDMGAGRGQYIVLNCESDLWLHCMSKALSIAWSPDGMHLACSFSWSENGHVVRRSGSMWSTASLKSAAQQKCTGCTGTGSLGVRTEMAFGGEVVGIGKDRVLVLGENSVGPRIAVWDIPSASVIGCMPCELSSSQYCSISDNGKWIAVWSDKGIVQLWDAVGLVPVWKGHVLRQNWEPPGLQGLFFAPGECKLIIGRTRRYDRFCHVYSFEFCGKMPPPGKVQGGCEVVDCSICRLGPDTEDGRNPLRQSGCSDQNGSEIHQDSVVSFSFSGDIRGALSEDGQSALCNTQDKIGAIVQTCAVQSRQKYRHRKFRRLLGWVGWLSNSWCCVNKDSP